MRLFRLLIFVLFLDMWAETSELRNIYHGFLLTIAGQGEDDTIKKVCDLCKQH